jgi:hypothetical protein
MPINLTSVRNELFPGLAAITGQYDQIPSQWDKIFDRHDSRMVREIHSDMAFLGLPYFKGEGAATMADNQAGDRFTYQIEHNEVGLLYAITRKAIDDNLYKEQFRESNLGLQRSFSQFKEILCANVLSNGNVYNAPAIGDGQPLFSTVHPIDGGVFGNRPSIDMDLGEAALLSAQIAIRTNFRDNRGLKIMARAKKLIVPPALEPVAVRLTKTELRPGTSDNDVNAIKSVSGGISEGYAVMDFLASPFAWFIKTDIPGLRYYDRVKFEMSMQTDFDTDNLKVKGYERYGVGYINPRCAWGTFPTS